MAVLAPVNVTIGCLLMLSVQPCKVDDVAQVQSLYHYLIIRGTGSGGAVVEGNLPVNMSNPTLLTK